jgi:serine/threonine protein kinase
MFLWADGGNLRDFWRKFPTPTLTACLVRDMIGQLRGMADALQSLHGYKEDLHFRHGDIKPENILHFPDQRKSRIGTFKISDLGSSVYHAVVTHLREQTGGKAWATMRYQPPEAKTNPLAASSRLYDIWSMGCVTLEFMIWLLYGNEELQNFSANITGKQDEASSFFEVEPDRRSSTSKLVAHIHPTVQACLDHISKDPECEGKTALGDLLEIVRQKLLVVQLPEHSSSIQSKSISLTSADARHEIHHPFGNQRINATGFVNALDAILKCESETNKHYWSTGKSRENVRRLSSTTPKIAIDYQSSSSHLHPEWRATGSIVDRTKKSPSLGTSASLAVPIGKPITNASDNFIN